MSVTVSDWVEDVTRRQPESIRRPVRVTGERNQHLGPRWEYAQIEVIAEPADHWDVSIELPGEDFANPDRNRWLREAILGILDVLMTKPIQPVLKIRLRLVGAKFDPVDSTEHAFRLAGRDAGEKLLANL